MIIYGGLVSYKEQGGFFGGGGAVYLMKICFSIAPVTLNKQALQPPVKESHLSRDINLLVRSGGQAL